MDFDRLNTHRNAILLGLSTLFLSWCWMQAVHELGHVLGAWVTGGCVRCVELHPLSISRTEVSPNPSAVTVTWAGPVCGVVLPITLWLLLLQLAIYYHSLRAIVPFLRFFAGFCLIANGAYLGAAVLEPVGDARDLIQVGEPVWRLGVFGLVTIPTGFALWNAQGNWFGWGPNPRTIPTREVTTMWGILIASWMTGYLISC